MISVLFKHILSTLNSGNPLYMDVLFFHHFKGGKKWIFVERMGLTYFICIIIRNVLSFVFQFFKALRFSLAGFERNDLHCQQGVSES